MIPRCKIVDCSVCGNSNVKGRKVGKKTYCFACYDNKKKEESFVKAIKKYERRKAAINVGSKLRKETSKRDIQVNSLQALKLDLDREFSLFIRLKYADERGIVICFTCDRPMHYKNIQCGHFVSRSESITRYLEGNNFPQCPRCNSNHELNISVYAKKLNEIKPGFSEELIRMGKEVYKYTQDEIKELIYYYRDKNKLLKQKLING